MYSTVHELVCAERKAGLDAYIIDSGNDQESNMVEVARKELTPIMSHAIGQAAKPAVEASLNYLKSKKYFAANKVEPGFIERGIEIKSYDWAIKEADIMIGHSGFPNELQNLDKPYIMCMHGRPRSSFLLEVLGQYPIYSGYVGLNEQKRIRKFVTFWAEHNPNHELLVDANKIAFVPPMVDLDVYNPVGEKAPLMNPNKFNILIADVWREDTDPYDVVHACHIFCLKHPEARFHMFGCKPTEQLGPWRVLLGKIKMHNTIGTHVAMVQEMPSVYRAVDMVVTPHRIATRIIRESLASGVPLVAADGCPYTPYKAPVWDYERFVKEMERCYEDIKLNRDKVKARMRELAMKYFNPDNSGAAMSKVIEDTLKEWKEVGRAEVIASGQMGLDHPEVEIPEAMVMGKEGFQ